MIYCVACSFGRLQNQFILGAISLMTCAGFTTALADSISDIVGGVRVAATDPIFSGAVALQIEGETICTGILIDKRTVVTAAHCIMGSEKPDAVVFGNNTLKEVAIAVKSEGMQPHPNFSWGNLDSDEDVSWPSRPFGDIAVIVMSKNSPSWAVPIAIKNTGEIEAGRKVILAGYGRTLDLSPVGFLRKVSVILDKINSAGWELIYKDPDPRSGNGHSACHGDSGGPMYYSEEDGSLSVIGVTSRAVDAVLDCRISGVYTDARKYVDWIATTKKEIESTLEIGRRGR